MRRSRDAAERLDRRDDDVGRQSVVRMWDWGAALGGDGQRIGETRHNPDDVAQQSRCSVLDVACNSLQSRQSSITPMSILVTGGAGYIGSHVVRQLGERGERVVVLDNLSTGFRSAVLHGEAGRRRHRRSRAGRPPAARAPASTRSCTSPRTPSCRSRSSNPLKYYGNNTCSTRSLLQCCQEAGVKHFVFSSTAAVYGIPAGGIAAEDTPDAADQSVRHVEADERVDAARPRPPRLRCATSCCATSTSPASDPGGRIGQSTINGTLLTKVACEAAVGKRPHVSIFGTDYPTPDGTGVRDYIHVEDLAERAPARRSTICAAGRRVRDAQLRLRPRLQRARSDLDGESAERPAAQDDRRAAPRRRSADRWWPGRERVREVLGWSPQHDDLGCNRALAAGVGSAGCSRSRGCRRIDSAEELAAGLASRRLRRRPISNAMACSRVQAARMPRPCVCPAPNP